MDPSETWLQRWHDVRPGATSRAFLRGKPSTYEWLAEHARPGDRVLDLACGDGALLSLLRARGIQGAVGIDMSEGELAAARARLGPEATLVKGRAQELPFEDSSFDLVTCHLALMLMRPVEEALAEVRRVLRPGGAFAAVVGGRIAGPTDDAWTLLVRRLREEPFEGPSIGDLRTYSEEGLRELLQPFVNVRIEPILVDLSGTPDQVLAQFRETYDITRMVPARVSAFEEALRVDWQALLRPDGTLPCSMGTRWVSATTQAPR
ncbi:class I SAM-dependent methyltransferase [Polyangium sp. 15x6]|uniref:class I SAM-dependent methyltransferase n=1 Tax=Polyangium sp. 15x6 TaxID=3042687 RepID=UPI00249C8305|nr:class I SAM-dependent methyltransferase [Polyangium sp. 15x6]MDI3281890.1 class I SAM-dependent methyltransferase [Polyangium sp. 15x6]